MVDPSFDELSRNYKFFSRIVGLLPFEGRGSGFLGTRFLIAFVLLNTFVDLGMIIGYDIDAIVERRPLKAEDLYISILATSFVTRYYMLLLSREINEALFEKCRQLWQFCDPEGRGTVKGFERKIRLVYGIYAGSTLMCNILVPINAYFARLPPTEPNGTEQRVLPLNWFVHDEPYKYLGYHATFMIQSVVMPSTSITGMVCDATISGFVMLAAGYFRQLRDHLAGLSQYAGYSEIMDCIKYHQKLLEYSYNLKKFSQTIIFVQIISSYCSISLVLLKLVSPDPNKYSHVPLMGMCLCQLFLIQWTPDRLADESAGVAYATYSALMGRLEDKRIRRNLSIMLARAQVPVQFMAGGVVVLSLENYASMMKGAFSFFMVLRTVGL